MSGAVETEAAALWAWLAAPDEPPPPAVAALLADEAALGALVAALEVSAPPDDPAGRWACIADRLDRPVAPAGVSPALLDGLHAALAPPAPLPRPAPRGGRRWRVGVALLAAAVALVVLWPRPAPTVLLAPGELVPAAAPTTRGTGPVAAALGPVLSVRATVGAGGLRLQVSATPGPEGVPVDPGSLRLGYGGRDLTARLGAVALPLDRSGLQLPPGRHRFTVSVADVAGQRSAQTLEVVVP